MLGHQRASGQALERLAGGELEAFFLVFVAEPEQAEVEEPLNRIPADFFKLEYLNL